jgi:hypothetical protein
MDNLTNEIKKILDTTDSQIDVEKSAKILLQINRNRILHDSIIRRKNIAKLKYEFQKIYDFRMQEQAVEETKVLEKQAVVILNETLPKIEQKEAEELKGKRTDHDLLPDEIKAKLIENQNAYQRLRKLHEQLKLLNNGKPCDRYPFLKELKELDEKIRRNWDEYDAFVIVPPVNPGNENPDKNPDTGETLPIVPPVVVPDAKKISAARKYLSDNKSKLAELKSLDDQSKYLALLDKMQERLTLLIVAKAGISDEQLKELSELGLNAQ